VDIEGAATQQMAVLDNPPAPTVATTPAVNWVMQPAENLGAHTGHFLLRGIGGNSIYFGVKDGDTPQLGYFNLTSQEFGTYSESAPDLFYGLAVVVGYSYGICNGAIFNDTTQIEPSVSSSYKDACDSING
jgi:hypothetical protein